MDSLTFLILLENIIFAFNCIIALILYRANRIPVFKLMLIFWIATTLQFMTFGVIQILTDNLVIEALIGNGIILIWINHTMLKILHHISKLKFNPIYYFIFTFGGILLAVITALSGFGFTTVATISTYSICLSTIYYIWQLQRHGKIESPLINLFYIIYLLALFHLMNYPFLRLVEWFTPYGFTIHTAIHVNLAVLLPYILIKENLIKHNAEIAARGKELRKMDKINHIIQSTTDLNQMLQNIMRAVLGNFECDRAWLLFPCDPDSPTYRIPVECSRPEYPIAFTLNKDIPMKPGGDELCRTVLSSNDPVPCGPAFEHKVSPELTQQFGVQSLLVTAIYPLTGKPWVFGMHQCSYARSWTPQEIRLFKDIGRRLTDGLSSRLFLHNLQKSEYKFRSLVESSSDWIWEVNTEGVYTYASPQVEAMIGYKPEEVVGKTTFDLMLPEEAKRIAEIFKGLVETGRPIVALENVNLHKDGRRIVLETSGVPVIDTAGHVIGYRGVDRDITERKQTEEALRESENSLREAQQLAHLGNWFWDIASGAVKWSDEVFKIFRLDPDEFTPKIHSILALSPWPENHQRDRQLIQKAIESREVGSYEQRFLRPDGSQGYYLSTFQGIYDDDGNLIAMKGTVQDTTERKQIEESLKKAQNYIVNIINSMPSLLISVDTDGIVTQWNKTAEQTTGIAADNAQGKLLSDVFPRMASEMEKINISIRTREIVQNQKKLRSSESGTRYEDVTIYPLIPNGVEGAVIRIDDVTDKVRMEEMMIQSEKMLSVGGLATGMAHEINNPLAGMVQTAHVLASRLDDSIDMPANLEAAKKAGTSMEAIRNFMESRSIPRMIATILESGRRVAAIVDNMLSFARKSEAKVSSHSIAELFDKTLELARTDYHPKKQYDFKMIEIKKEYENNLPFVPCEGAKIQQVLLNIFRNGGQAMQKAGTETPLFIIRTRFEKELEMVCLEIEDNGPGMDEEIRKRVFEPFFTTKSAGMGTGLGLSVSYFIITENHGGEMAVESQPGHGTRFTIRLPLGRSTK